MLHKTTLSYTGGLHKLQTSEGKLADPKTLSAWTHNFSKIPEFPFEDPLQFFGR